MSLVNELIKGLLPEEENKKTTALYAGGFKPPTSGHFEVVQQALEENPEIDEFIIFVGNKDRDGISQQESMIIWDIYKQYLPLKVKIEPVSKPPIRAVYNYSKDHPMREVLWVIGARDGNEEDFKDISTRTKSMSNYPNLELRTIVTKGGVSGTAARNAAKTSLDKFVKFTPSQLSDEEKQEVYNIVSDKIQEAIVGKKIECDNCDWSWDIKDGGDDLFLCHKCGHDNTPLLNENSSYSQHIDILGKIDQLNTHMINKGMNVEPLPTVELINGDVENAKNFLGRTAYYDPNNSHIVLYTEGRHPKDIVRSYAHEMIHHIQNLEGRLGNITTTNTHEDSELNKIEAEANLKGTMTFRNWTDTLNEAKKEVNNSMVAILSRNGNQISLYNFDSKEPLGLINTYGNEVTGIVAKKGYGPLMYELGMANVYPNGLQSDRNGNTEPEAEAVLNKFIEGSSPNIKIVKLTPEDKDYRTKYPNGNEVWDVDGFYNHKFYNANTSTLKQLIQRGNKLYPNEQTQIISDTEEMYDSIVNEEMSSLNESQLPQEKFSQEMGQDFIKQSLSQIPRRHLWDISNPTIEVLPLSDVKPTQFGEDYINSSSEYEAEQYKKYMKGEIGIESLRKEDFYPIIVDKDTMEIIDGNHRHAVHKMLGIPKIKTILVSKKLTTETLLEEEDKLMAEVVNPDGETFEYEESNLKGLYTYKDSKDNLFFSRIFYQNTSNPYFEFKVGWFKDNDTSKPLYEPQLPPNVVGMDNLKRRNTVAKIYRDEIIPYFKEKSTLSNLLIIYPISDLRYTFSKRLVQNYTPKTFEVQYDNRDKKFIKILSKKINENKTKDPFGLNAYAMELGRLREEETEYQIYCDMDGVLADFERGYEELTGIDLQGEFKPDGEEFWDPIAKAGVKFWAGLKWMPGGQQLWDYIKQYNPKLLSAPSREESSKIGKFVWVKHKIPGTKLILRSAFRKKEFANPNSILIDDRIKNIEDWEAAGGIGILHTNTANTIKQLQKLSL